MFSLSIAVPALTSPQIIEKVRSSPRGFQTLVDEGLFSRLGDDDSASDVVPPAVNPTEATPQVPQGGPIDSVIPNLQPPAEANPPPAEPAAAPNESAPAMAGMMSAPISPTAPVPPPPSFTRICRECSHELFLSRLYDWWAEERQVIVNAANAPTVTPPPAAPTVPTPASATDPPQQQDGSSDTEEEDNVDDDDDDDDSSHRPPSSSRQRARVSLPTWATSPDRKDCPQGRTCTEQHAPSHAKECMDNCLHFRNCGTDTCPLQSIMLYHRGEVAYL